MISQIFDIFSHEFSLFSTQLTFFRPKNSIVSKKDTIHVRNCQKFAKSSCRPMFFTTKQKPAKHSTVFCQSCCFMSPLSAPVCNLFILIETYSHQCLLPIHTSRYLLMSTIYSSNRNSIRNRGYKYSNLSLLQLLDVGEKERVQ